MLYPRPATPLFFLAEHLHVTPESLAFSVLRRFSFSPAPAGRVSLQDAQHAEPPSYKDPRLGARQCLPARSPNYPIQGRLPLPANLIFLLHHCVFLERRPPQDVHLIVRPYRGA
jgi:hypothetical protein